MSYLSARHLVLIAMVYGCGTTQAALAQAKSILRLALMFGHKPLFLDSTYSLHGNTVTISTFKFYLSDIKLMQKGQPAWAEPDSYHLIDAADTASLRIGLRIPPGLAFDALAFNLGIDSATNARGALGGELDATKGMYWAWHSGYINLKIEGSSPVCSTRKHKFQYHLGGFRSSEIALQQIILPAKPAQSFVLPVDVPVFLKAVNLGEEPVVMSAGVRGVALARQAAAMFTSHGAR